MGVHRPDGKSLLKPDGKPASRADNFPSFTLGSVNVAPMSMAAAYATPLPARGIYCHPIVVTQIVDPERREAAGASRPGATGCCPTEVADAANYILQGELTGTGPRPAGHRPPGGGQDRDRGQLRLRRLRRLHPGPAGRVSVSATRRTR